MLILHGHFTCSFYKLILHAILLIKLLHYQHWLVDHQTKLNFEVMIFTQQVNIFDHSNARHTIRGGKKGTPLILVVVILS